MGQDNVLILDNLKKLSAAGATINLRLPLIVPVNTDDQDIQDIISFLKENNIRILKTNLLPYHNTGNHKYEKLGEEYKGVTFENLLRNAWKRSCSNLLTLVLPTLKSAVKCRTKIHIFILQPSILKENVSWKKEE